MEQESQITTENTIYENFYEANVAWNALNPC